MPLSDLSEQELNIVKQCLYAAADGPFFEDWEFHTLFGLEREVVRDVASRFPGEFELHHNGTSEDDYLLAINNSLNNLIGYPHSMDRELSQMVSATKDELENIFDKFLGLST